MTENQITARVERDGQTVAGLNLYRGLHMGDDHLTWSAGTRILGASSFNGWATPSYNKENSRAVVDMNDLASMGNASSLDGTYKRFIAYLWGSVDKAGRTVAAANSEFEVEYQCRIRYILTGHSGTSYRLICRVDVRVSHTLQIAWVVFRPEPAQFRPSAIRVLLLDVRNLYYEASADHELARLSDRVVLELMDPVSAADVSWMQHQAWLLGMDLLVR